MTRRYTDRYRRLPMFGRIVMVLATLVFGFFAIGLVFGVISILLPFLAILGLAKAGKSGWHISGQSDEEWAEDNDRRALGEDY